jgi:hypothetical protein
MATSNKTTAITTVLNMLQKEAREEGVSDEEVLVFLEELLAVTEKYRWAFRVTSASQQRWNSIQRRITRAYSSN